LEFNTPPDGLTNSSSGRVLGSSDTSHFINVQSVVHDAKGRLWALDTGRPVLEGGDNPPAAPGGPKLVGFDFSDSSNGTIPFKTITFSETVLPALGYLNDIRFDLSPNLTASGEGVAYIADSGEYIETNADRPWWNLADSYLQVHMESLWSTSEQENPGDTSIKYVPQIQFLDSFQRSLELQRTSPQLGCQHSIGRLLLVVELTVGVFSLVTAHNVSNDWLWQVSPYPQTANLSTSLQLQVESFTV
jgi:hypothetical protein